MSCRSLKDPRLCFKLSHHICVSCLFDLKLFPGFQVSSGESLKTALQSQGARTHHVLYGKNQTSKRFFFCCLYQILSFIYHNRDFSRTIIIVVAVHRYAYQ